MKRTLIFFSIFLLLLTGCMSVQDVNVTIDEVSTANVGETIEMQVTIQNFDTVDRLLTSVDIGDDYLEGMTLLSSNPSWTQEWDFGWMGFQSYDYQISIPAGESLSIIYAFQAEQIGSHEGTFDVCFDTEYDCIYNTIFTSVSDAVVADETIEETL